MRIIRAATYITWEVSRGWTLSYPNICHSSSGGAKLTWNFKRCTNAV